MSTTVSYKGSTIATLSNETKTLTTAGTWVEGDIVVTDSGGTAAISVVDTTDSHGGTIREITALDISDTTAVASDVAQGKYFYTASGVKTAGTGSCGSTPSATAHTIYFEFSDSTNTTITAYYDSTFISSAITATTPTTYGSKTVELAQLDGVTWYTRPIETWETIFNNVTAMYVDGNTRYFWLTTLGNVTIPLGSVWRITLDNTVYDNMVSKTVYVTGIGSTTTLGNPKFSGDVDDGSNVPFCFYNYNGNAWAGDTELPAGDYSLKIERLITS